MRKKTFVPVIFLIMMALFLTACGKSYNVSGKVIDLDQKGVQGVEIILTGGTNGSVTTASDGSWIMSGLKGTVTITPQKDGWVFDPWEITVNEETTGVKFAGTNDPESLVEDMLERYVDALNREDVDGVMEFLDDSFYTNIGKTKEEYKVDLENQFASGSDTAITIKSTDIELKTDTADGLVTVGTAIGGEESWDYIWELSLHREGFTWKITNLVSTIYQLYYDKPYIAAMVEEFIQAFSEEDIEAIRSMTSGNYSYIGMDKEDFIAYIEELFTRIKINNYEISIDLIDFNGIDNYARVHVYADMVTDGVTQDRTLLFQFGLVKEGDNWMVKSLSIDSQDSILLNEWEIDEPEGESDFIPLEITLAGDYTIETSYYKADCDTELRLYNDSYEELAFDQDTGDGMYSLLNVTLPVGTFYLKVREVAKEHLYCKLQVSRLGL